MTAEHAGMSFDPEQAWAEFADGDRICYFCHLPILPEDHPATSKDGGHYAHFTCWYDGSAMPPARFERTDA